MYGRDLAVGKKMYSSGLRAQHHGIGGVFVFKEEPKAHVSQQNSLQKKHGHTLNLQILLSQENLLFPLVGSHSPIRLLPP